jgi:Xaa-Pro aminopeptidase
VNKRAFPTKFDLPFPRSEFEDRFLRVERAMEASELDATVVTDARDFYWLTGSRMRIIRVENPGWIIIWDGEPIGVVRHLELESHQCCSTLKEWVVYRDEGPINPYDPVGATADTLRRLGLDKASVGINFRSIGHAGFRRFEECLPDANFQDFRVEKIRIKKSKLEQECQYRAAKANQDALMNTINEMDIGWSERDIQNRIFEYHEKFLGEDYERSTGMFQTGRHTGHMHLVTWPPEQGAERIKKGDLLYLEPGTFVKRYVGCMIRSVFFGEPPAPVRRAAEASIEALNRAIEAIAPGKTAHEVDKIARDHFEELGLDCQSRIGYSCGIVWSEGPVLAVYPNNPLILEPGHIIHCLALNYVQDWGFIGASEQVLVTEKGNEVLADRDRTCPREFFIK